MSNRACRASQLVFCYLLYFVRRLARRVALRLASRRGQKRTFLCFFCEEPWEGFRCAFFLFVGRADSTVGKVTMTLGTPPVPCVFFLESPWGRPSEGLPIRGSYRAAGSSMRPVRVGKSAIGRWVSRRRRHRRRRRARVSLQSLALRAFSQFWRGGRGLVADRLARPGVGPQNRTAHPREGTRAHARVEEQSA